MLKTFSTAAMTTALICVPAAVLAADTTFTNDGVRYTFSETDMGSYTLINGRDSAGKRFRLVVRGGYVSGTYGTATVDFRVRNPVARAEVAAR